MSSPEVKGLTGHNASSQEGVVPNPDPALEFANEHQHEHLHHGGLAANPVNHPDELIYSTATPDKDLEKPRDYAAAEKSVTDEDSGNVGNIHGHETDDRRKQFIRRWYRILRPYIHFFIWAVFTA